MENKKLIAEALLELARNSETTIIDIAEDKELIDAGAKLGIVLPSPDLSVIKTVYAEVDKSNLNGVVLPKEAVIKGLPTLVGKQINWEHDGAGRVCGYIIDAKLNEDKIEIIGVIFKSLFPEEMDAVETKFSEKKLTVSFEIWNRSPETGESVVHELEDGFRSLDPIIFHGCGLLLNNNPACPKAVVYKLVASKEIENAEKIVEKIFEDNLICASMAVEEPKCQNCKTCTCKHEEEIVEEIKKAEEAKPTLCPECQQELKDEEMQDNICAVCKTKKLEKNKAEEKAEEKVEIKVEDATIVTTVDNTVVVDELKENVEVVTTKVKEEVTIVDDSGKEEMKEVTEITKVVTYTFEEVQEQLRVAKEEKDQEISALKEEVDSLKKELEQKSQEIAKLTVVEVASTDEKKNLTVGGVTEIAKEDPVKKEAQGINDWIKKNKELNK